MMNNRERSLISFMTSYHPKIKYNRTNENIGFTIGNRNNIYQALKKNNNKNKITLRSLLVLNNKHMKKGYGTLMTALAIKAAKNAGFKRMNTKSIYVTGPLFNNKNISNMPPSSYIFKKLHFNRIKNTGIPRTPSHAVYWSINLTKNNPIINEIIKRNIHKLNNL